MRDVNVWTITGNLTKDPHLNHLDDGTAVAHLRVAVSVRREGGDPLYVDVTTWRRDAECCAEYLRKGSRVCVTGPLQASLVVLKDGRTVLDLAVEAKSIEFMGGPRPKAEADELAAESRAPEPAARPAKLAAAGRRG